MKLYFDNGEEKRLLYECDTKDSCVEYMHQFLAKKNYKSYYQRYTETDYGWWIDVGCYTQFFEIHK